MAVISSIDSRSIPNRNEWKCDICWEGLNQPVLENPDDSVLKKPEDIVVHRQLFFDNKSGEKHSFHRECLEKWLEKKNTCPICRTPLYHSRTLSMISSLATHLLSCSGAMFGALVLGAGLAFVPIHLPFSASLLLGFSLSSFINTAVGVSIGSAFFKFIEKCEQLELMSTKKATIAKVANIAFGVFFSAMGAPAGVVLLSTTIVTVVLASYAIKRAENQEYSCSELALRSGFVAAAIACGQCLSQGLVTNVFLRVIGGVFMPEGLYRDIFYSS